MNVLGRQKVKIEGQEGDRIHSKKSICLYDVIPVSVPQRDTIRMMWTWNFMLLESSTVIRSSIRDGCMDSPGVFWCSIGEALL